MKKSGYNFLSEHYWYINAVVLQQHSWNPPLIKGGGLGPFKNLVTWGGGGTTFFARKGG